MNSEENRDEDTGFYSDGEEAPAPKRRSLLVALTCVSVYALLNNQELNHRGLQESSSFSLQFKMISQVSSEKIIYR